jgi:hypothetical protein
MAIATFITVASGDGLELTTFDNRGAKTETLRSYDGKAGYSLAQGQ